MMIVSNEIKSPLWHILPEVRRPILYLVSTIGTFIQN